MNLTHHTFTCSNQETLAYTQTNTPGPVLLLVHGNMSSRVFFYPTMQRLASSMNVIAVDMRGFGDSSYHHPFDGLDELASDLNELVEHLAIRDVTLLGWSTGGGVVLEMAAAKTDRFRQVILLDSVGLTGYPMYQKDQNGQADLSKPHRSKETVALDPVQVLPILIAYQNRDKGIIKMIWNALIYNLKQPEEAVYDLHCEEMFKQRNLVDIDYSLMMFNMSDAHSGFAPGNGRAHLIQCPVHIWHGEKDLVVPVAYAHAMKDFFKDQATLHIIPEVGHAYLNDNFEAWIDDLKRVVLQ
jgi:2-hydroxy-6-oxonona-2,4-dienedioate hydrolase